MCLPWMRKADGIGHIDHSRWKQQDVRSQKLLGLRRLSVTLRSALIQNSCLYGYIRLKTTIDNFFWSEYLSKSLQKKPVSSIFPYLLAWKPFVSPDNSGVSIDVNSCEYYEIVHRQK